MSKPSLVHHKPTGQARVRINGRDFYCGKFGSPESLARYQELLAQHTAGTIPSQRRKPRASTPAPRPIGPLTVELLAAKYLTEHCAVHYRYPSGEPTQEVSEIRRYLQRLIDFTGRMPASEFGPKRLKEFRQTLIDAGLCRSLINQTIGRVRRVFKWAASEELLPVAVYQSLMTLQGLQAGRSAAVEHGPVLPVEWETVEKTLPFLTPPLRAVVLLQWHCGARGGELLSMRRCDVDTTGEIWTFIPARHKTSHRGKRRTILFGKEAQAVLTPFLDRKAGEQFLFCPRDVRRRDGIRERYDSRSYAHSVRRACERAGVEHWHPHQLRHAYATRVRKLAGIEQARVLLGHSSAVTSELYAEMDLTAARAVVVALG